MKIYLLSPPEEAFIETLPELLKAGVDWFQYRRPGLDDERRINELAAVRRITEAHGVKLIVNNRPDLALVSSADGVHLGSDDLPSDTVKERWPGLIVGVTRRADDEPVETADYYGVGPVFEPASKSLDVVPCGWEGVAEFAECVGEPVFAIGGITPGRMSGAPERIEGVAVISSVWNRDDPLVGLQAFINET